MRLMVQNDMGRVSDAKERLMEAVRELIWTGSYGSTTFTVAHSGDKTNSYQVWNPIISGGTSPTGSFAWSKNSGMYHFESCQYVENISPANLQTGTSAPSDKTLHPGCPK